MLKFKEKIAPAKFSLEFDEHIPFIVEFGEDPIGLPLYWRIGDGSKSLMEIELNKKVGSVNCITLTSINLENARSVKYALESNEIEEIGSPTFELTNWPETIESRNYSDHFSDDFDSDINLDIGRDFISVIFKGCPKELRYIRNGSVRFGLDKYGFLSKIDIMKLSTTEINVINSIVQMEKNE